MEYKKKEDLIDRSLLGIAGEYAVASEICRRNYFAQITLGTLKRTDILVFNPTSEKMLRIEVKSKQKNEWPGVKGMKDDNSILILVDFANKKSTERPDFYILNRDDWNKFLDKYFKPHKSFKEILEGHIPVWVDGYKGIGIMPNQVEEYKEKWEKITQILGEE